MRDGQSSYLPPDDEACHLKRARHPPTTGKETTGRASDEFSSSRCPTLPAPVRVPGVHGAAGAKFPCSQSATDCLAGLESATRDDVAAGTVRLTVDGLRHCSFPALSTGESRPGWKDWFCGSMVCFSIGGWTGTKWSLRGSPGSIRNIRENLCGVFLPPAGYAGRFGGDRVRDSWRTAFPGFLR